MSRFFTSKLAGLVPYTPGEQPANPRGWIKLNTNENPFPPSPLVLEALNRAETERLRLYSDPECRDFLDALAATYGVEPSQVIASNGSDETLAFCFQAFCERGAAFPDITYGFYTVFADLYGVPKQIVPLREDFSVAVADYEGLQQTLFVANPNAPTGLALSRAEIETLLLQNPDRLVVIDEAYVDFGAESATPLLSAHENLLIVGTFSKSRSLAGARLGFAVGSPALIADLNAVKFSFNPYNVNRLTLAAGRAALADEDYFERCSRAVCHNRERTSAQLASLGFTLTDSKANFLFAKCPDGLSGKNYFDGLRARDILVRRWDAPRIADWLRITVGTAEQMDALVAATKEILKEHGIPSQG